MSDTAPVFAPLPADVSFPAMEERILALWERIDAFAESNRRRSAAPEYVFYDGPPFATGTPHYGHLLAGTIKDIVPRYWTMRGHHVERRFGWDCHGLPIESLAQQSLGWSGAAEIRARGVGVFNDACRQLVSRYVADWRRTVTRMGRWVDFDRDYKTMDRDFMESVWWVFKQLWDQGRIYRSHRIMPYSWKLTTPLSNFEIANSYREVQDPAITVAFRLAAPLPEAPGEAEVLAWTTTPWTLPANLALAVGPDIVYDVVARADRPRLQIIAHDRVEAVVRGEAVQVVASLPGRALAGRAYHPLFPAFAPAGAAAAGTYRILADAFVSTGDGTGIVHLAPAYGEDDYRVCRAAGIALVDPLDEEARFRADCADAELAGVFCKDADRIIIRRLKEQGSLEQQATIDHSYPFCERTNTPLIYRAIEGWYVRVEDMRDRLVANNAQIRWVPEAIGANRFGNWLQDAKDWNISRNRFWGSCLPVWVAEDRSATICVGSIAELEALSGRTVTDLHKDHLDDIVIVRANVTYRRTPEVLDCWFESGAMPYAQRHYPFENRGEFERDFPAHFIAEGLDQTRGWFYTLLVLSTALFDKPAFRNVIVNGLILAEDGQKMSKTKKNYVDPTIVLDQIGADALRAYLIASPLVRAEPLRFQEQGLKEIVRTVLLPYWNALSLFHTYAAVDGYDPRRTPGRPLAERAELDRWISSVLQTLVRDVNREMEAYRLYTVVPALVAFIDDLTNWYIRLSRRRFWKSEDDADKLDAYATLYAVLVQFSTVLAPFMPFITEEIYQRLVVAIDPRAPRSVHWCDYPQVDATAIDAELERRMQVTRAVVALGRKLREEHRLKVRQPLAGLQIASGDPRLAQLIEPGSESRRIILEELNVRSVAFTEAEAEFCSFEVKPNLKELGRRCGPKIREITAALARLTDPADVKRLRAGGVTIAGELLREGDVLIRLIPRSGRVVASDSTHGLTVALDTALDEDLIQAGLAREFTSILQQARKSSGLAVADRIQVRWRSQDPVVAAAIQAYQEEIAREVLATAFSRDEQVGGTAAELNGRPIAFALG
jgi:isoleucyl-tRNA synthetase